MEDTPIPRSPARHSQEPVAVEEPNAEPQHSFHSEQSPERACLEERESFQASTESAGPNAVVLLKGIYYTESAR